MNILYTRDEIRERLLECDYPQGTTLLEDAVNRICEFCDNAAEMFNNWYSTGKTPRFEVNGISSDYLISTYGMKYPAMIIAYDWLMKEPGEAKRLFKKSIVKSTAEEE